MMNGVKVLYPACGEITELTGNPSPTQWIGGLGRIFSIVLVADMGDSIFICCTMLVRTCERIVVFVLSDLRAVSRVFDGEPEGLTRDDILDNVTLYWLTNTTISSARLYWESKLAFFAPKQVAIPVAVSAFPDELYQAPRSWTERAYPKLIYYNKVDKGGHFAAWEQREILVEELRAGFKSLR